MFLKNLHINKKFFSRLARKEENLARHSAVTENPYLFTHSRVGTQHNKHADKQIKIKNILWKCESVVRILAVRVVSLKSQKCHGVKAERWDLSDVWVDVIRAVPERGVADGHSAVPCLAHRESAQFWKLLRRLVDQKPQSTRHWWEEEHA